MYGLSDLLQEMSVSIRVLVQLNAPIGQQRISDLRIVQPASVDP
jgi:hypothetical protein